MIDIDKHLISYHDGGNDYRYAFSKEEVTEIKQALEFYESTLKNEDGYLATMCERNGYNKAIDDFVEHVRTYYTLKQEMGYVATTYKDLINYIFELAEQLKAGVENE